jgi:hypothetical protein
VWGRYIAPFVALLWLGLFTSIDLAGAMKPRRWLDQLAVPVALLVIYLLVFEPPFYSTVQNFVKGRADHAPTQWEIADGLNRMGVGPGAKIAAIGETIYTHWYRLAHVQVIAEIPIGDAGASTFWDSEPSVQAQILRLFAEAGAQAVVAHRVPYGGAEGWQRIGNTDAHVYFLTR